MAAMKETKKTSSAAIWECLRGKPEGPEPPGDVEGPLAAPVAVLVSGFGGPVGAAGPPPAGTAAETGELNGEGAACAHPRAGGRPMTRRLLAGSGRIGGVVSFELITFTLPLHNFE